MHLIGAFIFLILIVIAVMVYLYGAIIIVRYTAFFLRYLKPWVRLTIVGMFLLITLLDQTILVYVGGIWLLVWGLYQLFKNRNSDKGWMREKLKNLIVPPLSILYVAPKKTITGLFLVLALINGAYWLQQRSEWVNADHAHLDAKEYYAVGNVLLVYRSTLSLILSPENTLLRPLEWLQRAIVAQGVSLIPKEDAEWAMWDFRFFHYLYIRNTHLPEESGLLYHFTKKGGLYKPWVTEMMDDLYHGLDDLANKPMADRAFAEKEKYLAHPTMAMIYELGYFSYYSRWDIGSAKLYVKDKEGIKPLQNVVVWMEKMEREWSQHPEALKEIKSNPRLEVAHQMTILFCLEEIQYNKMYQGTFRCNDPWLLKVYPASKRFNADTSPFHRVTKQEQDIYRVVNDKIAILSSTAHEFCGYEVMTGDYMSDTIFGKTLKDSEQFPLNGELVDVYQLYSYAKRGIEQSKQQTQQGE